MKLSYLIIYYYYSCYKLYHNYYYFIIFILITSITITIMMKMLIMIMLMSTMKTTMVMKMKLIRTRMIKRMIKDNHDTAQSTTEIRHQFDVLRGLQKVKQARTKVTCILRSRNSFTSSRGNNCI